MPHISISLYPGRDEKLKQEIAQRAKDFFENEINFPKGSVSVSMVEVEPGVFPETIHTQCNPKDILIPSDVIKTDEEDNNS